MKTILRSHVNRVLCNRIGPSGDEEYLVQWTSKQPPERVPLSWQCIHELAECLDIVQDYVDKVKSTFVANRKRKSPDDEFDNQFSNAGHLRLLESSRASSVASITSTSASSPSRPEDGLEGSDIKVYNGTQRINQDVITVSESKDPDVVQVDARLYPTPAMQSKAAISPSSQAYQKIRTQFTQNLRNTFGNGVRLVNKLDKTSPSLRFTFTNRTILGDGVYKAPPETTVGCQKCSSHMGRGIGCEYTKKCDCLEYAAVDESRLDDADIKKLRQIEAARGDTMGFPKRFAYHSTGASLGCLVAFYLESRHVIYECNLNCKCGPICNNRNVQHGRKVGLEIFKTKRRGFGLRCMEHLRKGQFIDTYRGEILTDAEATRREQKSEHRKAKDSYLFSLDKFKNSEGLDDEEIYVVDGEYMGGPTRFMNHSCEPNCRIVCVSYNKHDPKVYDLAFFARVDIPAGTELTFDYMDKDDVENVEGDDTNEAGENPTKCRCGSERCRKFLWI